MPHILFVTTSNLATNPRLVKEVELAISLSYRVSILAFRFDNWSAPLNETIRERLRGKADIIEIPAGRSPFFPWFVSSLLHVLCMLLAKTGVTAPFVLSQALQKRTMLLMCSLKKISGSVDLVVAHNPGSFYPVMRMAQKRYIPYGIDVEDYHPGETNDPVAAAWIRSLMVHTIARAAYITAAAPLIMEYVQRDCSGVLPASQVVLNYFPANEFQPPIALQPAAPLRLVWFSQYIAAGRGLQLVIEAIRGMSDIELHLYGHPNPAFQKSMLESNPVIFIHGPLPQKDLHSQLARYDVGLALEQPASNLNRDLCITNKILAYLQSGLYILATNTSAQIAFLSNHPNSGRVIPPVVADLRHQILHLVQIRVEIRKDACNRFKSGNRESVNNELDALGSLWKSVIL